MRHASRLLLLTLLLLPLAGCRGCTRAKPKEELTEKEKEAEKKKDRILGSEMRSLPFGDEEVNSELVANLVKPGHWYQSNVKYKANLGEESLVASLSLRGKGDTKASFAPGQAPIEFNRNFSLAKGQEKNVRLNFFQPELANLADSNEPTLAIAQANVELLQRSVGTRVYSNGSANKLMAGYQYNLVTLSRDPSRYTFWRSLDCIVWPSMARFTDEKIAPHRVIDLNEDQIANQFPDKLYAMTSISHVVVNDTSLSLLSPQQKEALLDWLYFGGTIILNGPDCVSGLDSSFLKELAPMITSGTEVLNAVELESLNQDWTVAQVKAGKTSLLPDRPIPKLVGKLALDSNWVPYRTGKKSLALEGLVAERLVGQGRIVMSTFPMADYGLVKWPSYSSFIHNVILRKPHRMVVRGEQADTRFAGVFEHSEQNAIHSTRLRLWARDLDGSTSIEAIAKAKTTAVAGEQPNQMRFNAEYVAQMQNRERQYFSPKRSSLGSWNPESLILKNARSSLQESSGITVPKLNTILKLLVGYLVVLVPLNWLFFRLLGRVELAWVAAPFIAIVGAYVVAKSVQLDVGFSRSQTSIGFLEVHAGHPRGVLSKYTALYTSLSTNYAALFPNESGVVLPMPLTSSSESRRPRGAISTLEYWYADERGAGLRNLTILSNTTGLLHSEEVTELGKGVFSSVKPDASEATIENGLVGSFLDVGLISKGLDGKVVVGWLGDLRTGEKKSAPLSARKDNEAWLAEWDEKAALSKPNFLRSDDTKWTQANLGEQLYLGPILSELVKGYPLQPGETIAIGWTDTSLGSLDISPTTNQKKERTVLLVHLRPGSLGDVQPDESLFEKASTSEQSNEP